MVAVMHNESTRLFERTEDALFEWGAERNRLADALGIAKSSSIAAMIDRQKVFEQQRRGARKRKRTYAMKRQPDGTKAKQCHGCGTIYAALACPFCSPEDAAVTLGHLEAPLSVMGKTTRSSRAPITGFSATCAQVQAAIDTLPGWMAKTIYRAYQHRQPDRIAARELRMPREQFTAQKRSAVAAVAMVLAQRREVAARFPPPMRAHGEAPLHVSKVRLEET